MISLYVLCKCRGWERLRKGPWRDRYPITVAKSAEKWKMGIKLISSIPTNSCASCIARGLRSLNFNNFFFNCKILTHQFKVSLILVGLLWHHVHHVCIMCASCALVIREIELRERKRFPGSYVRTTTDWLPDLHFPMTLSMNPIENRNKMKSLKCSTWPNTQTDQYTLSCTLLTHGTATRAKTLKNHFLSLFRGAC